MMKELLLFIFLRVKRQSPFIFLYIGSMRMSYYIIIRCIQSAAQPLPAPVGEGIKGWGQRYQTPPLRLEGVPEGWGR